MTTPLVLPRTSSTGAFLVDWRGISRQSSEIAPVDEQWRRSGTGEAR